jgi:hypothetical protein
MHDVSHHGCHGVESPDQQQRRYADRLVQRDRPAVDLGRRDLADKVVARIRGALGDMLSGIFEQQRELLLLRRVSRDLGVR